MSPQIKSAKGVSRSGVRLFSRALALGFLPSRTSCGPANFLRRFKEAKRNK
jgi:hypothetical protein